MKPSILQKIKKYKIKEIQTYDNIGLAFLKKLLIQHLPLDSLINLIYKLPKINIIAEIKKLHF